ncbi:MAG: hypothetical protein LC118_08015 [Dehalococcoidia bacterium]|nr:hypothetical protein [Dehalococcoidia bacterium]
MREYLRKHPEKNRARVKQWRKDNPGRPHVNVERGRAALAAARAGGCIRCGYNDNPAAIQLHHRDPATKVRGALTPHTSLPRLQREIAKCDPLCANCHSIEHYS